MDRTHTKRNKNGEDYDDSNSIENRSKQPRPQKGILTEVW